VDINDSDATAVRDSLNDFTLWTNQFRKPEKYVVATDDTDKRLTNWCSLCYSDK
jgi:hypothetical protein